MRKFCNFSGSDAGTECSTSYPEMSGPFNTETLVAWGYQIANGMAYLTDRKVLIIFL